MSTPFAELRHYRGLVHVATSAGAFARAIREALARPGDPSTRRARVAGQTWNAKFDDVAQHLLEAGVSLPVAATSAVAARPAPHVVEVPLPRPAPTRRVAREASKRPDAAGQVRACIVLAGGLVPSPLVQATGRCVLDLWIGATETVLDRWVRRVGALAAAEESPIPIRVVHDAHGPAPWPREQDGHVRVELEPRPFRGPAGVLRDVCGAYGPDDEVVVVEAARDPQVELAPLVAAHRVRGAEVTVACDADGAPAGMYVVRCGALSSVAPAGYVDLKEQWLRGLCQEGRHVAVHVLAGAGAPPLRTPGQLLAAARRAAGASGEDEAWRVVCSGALIGPGAIVTGSIVMPGARIGAGSIVARSIVCAGTVVQAGTDIADAVVGVSRGLSDRRRDPASVTRDDHASGASIQALGEVERNA